MKRTALLVLAAVVVLPGCRRCSGAGDAPADAAPSPRIFSVAMAEPESYDPGLAAEEAGVTLSRALFEGLLSRPPGDGPVRPGVARAWEATPDGLAWTFHLRPDARWSDGSPVTAADFVYAWRRVLDPRTGSRSAPLLYLLDGAREVHSGAAPPERLAVEASDGLTLVVRLARPAPFFPDALAYPAYFPVPRAAVERFGAQWTRPETLVSNGPFLLRSYRPGAQAELARNDRWWNAGSVTLDGAAFRFVADERTAWDWFQAGRVHWLRGTLPRDLIPELRRTRPAEFHADPVLCTQYAAMRVTAPPFDDVRVRRAFVLAVDRERLVREVLMGGQVPARSLVPPSLAAATGYRAPEGDGFDPDRARALLAAHVRVHGPLPPVTYLYNSGEGNRLIAEFLQAEWRRNLGLDVAVQGTEWKSLLARVHSGDYQLARASWCADFVDAGNFLEVFETGSPSNYPGFSDADYDDLLRRAADQADPASRAELQRQAEARLLEAAPIVPLFHGTRIYVLSTAVTGFQPNLLDVHPLEFLDVR